MEPPPEHEHSPADERLSPLQPDALHPSSGTRPSAEPRPSAELVVRPAPAPVPASARRQRAAVLRARLPELARHPAVVAAAAVTASVGAQVLLSMLRPQPPGAPATAPAPVPVQPVAPLIVRAYVVQQVHVVHHLASARPPVG